jgi:hypothetical protein
MSHIISDEELIEKSKTFLPKNADGIKEGVIEFSLPIIYGVIPYNSNPLNYPKSAILTFKWDGESWINIRIKRHY